MMVVVFVDGQRFVASLAWMTPQGGAGDEQHCSATGHGTELAACFARWAARRTIEVSWG